MLTRDVHLTAGRLLLVICTVIIGIPAVAAVTSCTSGLVGFTRVVYCKSGQICCRVPYDGSRCCSRKSCEYSNSYRYCTSYSKLYCCPAGGGTGYSKCCSYRAYSSYSSSSSSSSWWKEYTSRSISRSLSRSRSRESYWSSVTKVREQDAARKEKSGIIAGSVIGVIVFIIFAICIPVIVCRSSAAKSSAPGRVTAQPGNTGGPQIAGVAPGPVVATYPQYAPTSASAPPYSELPQLPPSPHPSFQGPPSRHPSYQGPSSPNPSFQGPSSPQPSFQGPPSRHPSYQGPSSPHPSFQGPPSPFFHGPSSPHPSYQGTSSPHPSFQGPPSPFFGPSSPPTPADPTAPPPSYDAAVAMLEKRPQSTSSYTSNT